jgi:glutathione synthase/RimK-type ligase-like ATP-grasp enzyme
MPIAIATSQGPANLPPNERALLVALDEIGIRASAAVWSETRDWRAFSAVVVRSCWDYHLRPAEFLDWIAQLERLNIPVINPPSLIRWNADKRYLADLSQKGIAIPGTVWVAPGEELDLTATCSRHAWQTAVVKPLISASAHRTERRADGLVTGPMLIQEYVAEIETSGEWSLIYFGGAFSHAVLKRAHRGDFRVQKEFGGTAEPANAPAAVRVAADTVMATLDNDAAIARVDLVEARSSVLLMELELIEPELFLDLAPGASRRLADVIRSAGQARMKFGDE